MRAFFKWSVVVVAAGFGATLMYRAVQTLRTKLDSGLARVETVADEAQRALDGTRQSLEQTRRAVHNIREGLG